MRTRQRKLRELFFYHEPGATTSRVARLPRSPLPLAQSLSALARVIVVRVNPVPPGLCRCARHENALRATRKPLPSVVDGTKMLARFYRQNQLTRRDCRSRRKRPARHLDWESLWPICGDCCPTVFRIEFAGLHRVFHFSSLNARGRSEGFSCIGERLASFRVARNARFRDRAAGMPPLERGWGECRCREPKPQALSRATAAGAPIARCAMPAVLVRG